MRNSKKSPDGSDPAQSGAVKLEISEQSWQGPLPDPDSLKRFDEIVPNLSREIVTSWKEESAHRRSVEMIIAETESFERKFGRLSSLAFPALMVAGACGCAYFDQPWPAAVLASCAGLAPMVSAYLKRGGGD